MNFENKIALVTGSTSGIGKQTAQQLINDGAQVIVSSEKEYELSDIQNQFSNSEKLDYIACDIGELSQIENACSYIEKTYGKLDFLVSNAGIMPLPCGIDDISEENINKTLDVNLKGTFWCNKIFGKLIQDSSNSGAIVNVTSVDGLIGEPYGVMYSATKAGIISLTQSFARHFKDPLVRVNAVAPGLIDTPLTSKTGEDPSWTTDVSIIKRMGKAEEIANTIVFLLSEQSSFTTGQIWSVDGGFTLK